MNKIPVACRFEPSNVATSLPAVSQVVCIGEAGLLILGASQHIARSLTRDAKIRPRCDTHPHTQFPRLHTHGQAPQTTLDRKPSHAAFRITVAAFRDRSVSLIVLQPAWFWCPANPTKTRAARGKWISGW